MSIAKNYLRPWSAMESIRVKGGNQYSIETIRDDFEEAICNRYGVNASIRIDTLTSGKLFDKSTWQCIVIRSIEHPDDYNYIVVTYAVQGIYGLFDFLIGGNSKNAERINAGNREHSTITGSIIGSVRKAMVQESKLQEEQIFYTSISDALNEYFS